MSRLSNAGSVCKGLTKSSSPVALFVFSLLFVQITAEPVCNLDQPAPHVYTLGSDLSLQTRAKKVDYVAHPAGDLVCRPFGQCEPCPADEVRPEPF